MVETEDEGWVDKVEEERLAIISRYDKGREDGAQIDPWEDPAFEIYHVTDYYGFIHDNRLPIVGADEIKKKSHDVDRIDKWLKMHKGWNKYKNSEKLKKRVYKGIPNRLRGLFWGLLLDLEPLQSQQKGKYQEMYELARKYSPDIRQIDLDVNRTFRDHINFRERYGVKQKELFNILCAYSVYNSEVGYCQGMSQIAALLLLYLNEEEAFWALAQLMTHHRYAMHGFFIAGFPKLIRFQSHHDKILTTMLPKLKKHFDKHYVDAGLYTLKWFFQCFLDRIPYELALRYWDIYLLEGEKVLTCGAYSILKMHNKNLLGKKNMDDILTYLQSRLPSNFGCDTDTAIKFFGGCVEELHRKKLDTAGEPGDEELVKKPFGLVENIALPTPAHKKPLTTSIASKTPNTTSNNEDDSSFRELNVDVITEDNVSPLLTDSHKKPIHIAVETNLSPSPTLPNAPSPFNHSPELVQESNSSHASAPVMEEKISSLSQDNNGPGSSLSPHINKTTEIGENNSRSSSRNSPLRSNPSPQPVANRSSVQNNRPPPPPVSPRKMKQTVEIINVVENSRLISHHSNFTESIETISIVVENNSGRRPPSVSPRRTGVVVENDRLNRSSHKNTTVVSENSSSIRSRSRSTTTSVNIPSSTPQSLSNIHSGDTVRIHVPYSTSHFETTMSTTTTVSTNGFDVSKSDSNRNKIGSCSGDGILKINI